MLTLFKRDLNVSYIEINLASEKYEFAGRLINFIINEKMFFTIY